MDVLDQVLGPARDLLRRVDATLAGAGAPADHAIWPLLRRVGSLPGDALEFAAGVDVDALVSAADDVRRHAERYVELGEDIEVGEWTGPAASMFAVHWGRLQDHLAGPDGLAERLAATARHFDQLAIWGTALRREVALAVASALTSMEALTLHRAAVQRDGTDAALAAAVIGRVLLEPVAAALPEVEALLDAPAPDELPYRPPSAGAPGSATETRVPL